MLEILTGQFFWGIVVGLALSFFGAWLLANFSESRQNKYREKLVLNFCIDTIRNLRGIVAQMDDARDRTQVIYHDYLALIDIELGVFQRNREHLIQLPENERDLTRKFVNQYAIQKAIISGQLDSFQRMVDLADDVEAQGDTPRAGRIQSKAAAGPLQDAHQAVDKLVTLCQTANTDVVPALEKLKG